jgi:predicted DNA binding CopG/RHH family protein
MKTNKDLNFNNEEKELLESFNNGEWEKISDHENELKKFRELASDSLKKDKRINIRITHKDLTEIKRKAVHEGIPYQTLVSSILHKYVNGRFIEKPEPST